MGLVNRAALLWSKIVHKQTQKWSREPEAYQNQWLRKLTGNAKNTKFGKDHKFEEISSHKDFIQRVPIRDYEALRPYIDQVVAGQEDVLWPGKPAYLAKTSGTTSGVKYIPISKESMPFHIAGARNALLNYVYETKKSQFMGGKVMFLSGSPILEKKAGIHVGRLSGIVNHHVPGYIKKNQLPSYKTNCIEDWETKVKAVVQETKGQDMRLISGIPPWMKMYFDGIEQETGKKVGDAFPNFSLMVHGGVNFAPYRTQLFEAIGREVDVVETFPASEGFFAYQYRQKQEGLLLLLNHGIFYEFVPLNEIDSPDPTRLMIHEVKLGVNYAMILSTNAGLWGYNLGDTVKFVSKLPYLLVVSGRVKHYISAFGEHVIGEEVESSMQTAAKAAGVNIVEFTVAPMVAPESGLPYHEWLVEMDGMLSDNELEQMRLNLDNALRGRNTYYDDLIEGKILKPLVISIVKKDGFIDYMKSIGKLGGQNKVPRLSNNRDLANAMIPYIIKQYHG